MTADTDGTLNQTLQVECKNESAALERLLRVVRFRGFSVSNFHARLDGASNQLSVDLTVSGERPLHLLENQLLKNYEVTAVRVVGNMLNQTQGHLQGKVQGEQA